MEREVTAVVSTRNRGSAIVKTVETILANDYPAFQLIVVDQNDDDSTRAALERFFGRAEFVYRRSATRGLSAGRNEAIASCASELIVMTDDDCDVAPDWIRSLAAAFQTDPRIGVVFGNVLAAEHDRTRGFVPSFSCTEPFLATSILDKHRIEGIGACMAMRRSVWQDLHGFDESFGAGARFQSAEDLDLAIRALLSGYALYAAPAACVLHRGFRTWAAGHTLIAGYLFGIGATFAKLLRSGQWRVVPLLCRLVIRWAFGSPVVDLGHKPSRILRLGAFLRGFQAGLRPAIDSESGNYAVVKHYSAA